MRKTCSFVSSFILATCLILSNNSFVYASESARVIIDGEELQFNGQGALVDGGVYYVPAKTTLEKIALRVEWDSTTRTLKGYEMENIKLIITPNSDILVVDNQKFKMDAQAKVVNGTLMIPSSLPSAIYGYSVEYDSTSNQIRYTKDLSSPTLKYQKLGIADTPQTTEFKAKVKIYLNKTIYYVSTFRPSYVHELIDNSTGERAVVSNLTPMWIESVEYVSRDINKTGSPIYIYKVSLKSGNKQYSYYSYDANTFMEQFLFYNPINEKISQQEMQLWNEVKRRNIKIGMTEQMVLLAKGNPTKKYSNETANGKTEMWVYETESGTTYLHFNTKGILTTIQS